MAAPAYSTIEPKWPTRPDGTPKTMGEMTQTERRAQFDAAVRRLAPKFAKEGVRLVNGHTGDR